MSLSELGDIVRSLELPEIKALVLPSLSTPPTIHPDASSDEERERMDSAPQGLGGMRQGKCSGMLMLNVGARVEVAAPVNLWRRE